MEDIKTHKLRTDRCIIFKPDDVIHYVWPLLPLFKVKWSKSQSHVTYQQQQCRNLPMDCHINFKLSGNYGRGWLITWHAFWVSRSNKPKVEMWRMFSLSDEKINWTRPQIADISTSGVKESNADVAIFTNQLIIIYFPSSNRKNYNVINVVALERLLEKHYDHYRKFLSDSFCAWAVKT